MTDKHPEALKVEIGGELRHLKLGIGAFAIAEAKHGVVVENNELDTPNVAMLGRLVWIACLPDDPDLTFPDLMVQMANSDEGEIMRQIGKALNRMMESFDDLGDDESKAESDEPSGNAKKAGGK